MRIEQQWTDGVLALSLRGKCNTHEQREMLRATIEQLVVQGHRKMVLDLRGLRRVNSEGLGTLRQCLRVVRQSGGDLKLAAVSRRISDLIVVAGLLRVFDVHDTVPEAVRACALVGLALIPVTA